MKFSLHPDGNQYFKCSLLHWLREFWRSGFGGASAVGYFSWKSFNTRLGLFVLLYSYCFLKITNLTWQIYVLPNICDAPWTVSCFVASQMGWFPSTYVEEEEWLCGMNDYSASIRSRSPPATAMLLGRSLCPANLISLMKTQRLKTKEEAAIPSNTSSCPLTDSHTEQMSNYRFQERQAISRLHVARLPPRHHGKSACRTLITLHPPFLLTLSYYWWLHWLVWDSPSLSSCFNTRKAQSPNWNTDPADSAPTRYRSKWKRKSWGALTVVGTWPSRLFRCLYSTFCRRLLFLTVSITGRI